MNDGNMKKAVVRCSLDHRLLATPRSDRRGRRRGVPSQRELGRPSRPFPASLTTWLLRHSRSAIVHPPAKRLNGSATTVYNQAPLNFCTSIVEPLTERASLRCAIRRFQSKKSVNAFQLGSWASLSATITWSCATRQSMARSGSLQMTPRS
jgi:hypothetical protein